MKFKNKKFYIPHLHYQIEVKLAKGDARAFLDRKGWTAYSENFGPQKSIIFLGETPSYNSIPTIAHEIMHCLQYLARARSISMETEQEHFAYLLQWILAGILGLKIYQ